MNPSTTYRKVLLLAIGIWLAIASAMTMKARVEERLSSKKEIIQWVASIWISDPVQQQN